MGLFKRTSEDAIGPSWARVNGLVIKADAPPQGAPRFGPHSHGTIVVLADVPMRGQRQLSGTFRYAEEHWVVPAMDVPIAIDPATLDPAAFDSARSDSFVVDWQAVPSMQQQVESNHPALADPFAASRRIAAAIGITPSEKTASQSERFQAAAAAAAAKPAPAGRVRGVAMTVTIRGHYYASGGDDGASNGSGVAVTESSAAVLSVAIPGRAPYAVYVPKFKIPRKRTSIPGEAMPVLVSVTDPRDVEIVWDEMPGLGDQIAAKMADSMRSNSQLAAGLAAQFQAAQAQAMANYPPAPGAAPSGAAPSGAAPSGAAPAYPAGAMPAGGQLPAGFAPAGMPPQARQMLVDNLKRSLLYVTDPAQRQMVLDQYRAMGIEVTPEELGF